MSETISQFVHLHVHTQYSLLQGALHVDALFERAKKMGMSALAITDTNNLFGAMEFYLEAKKSGIKPIMGCEVLFAPQGRAALLSSTTALSNGNPNQAFQPKYHHLVLLCKNLKGYQNLCQIVTRAYTEAPPFDKKTPASTPRNVVDRDLLEKFSEGLIVLSGCMRGELPYKILMGDESGALESLQWFKKRFGEDFYLEIQDSGIPEQDHVNQTLSQWGEKYGVEVVATNDCHYLDEDQCEAHEILQCIEHGRNLDFDRPKSLVPAEYYLKSAETMRERFQSFPKACDNTLVIADKCDVVFKFKDEKGNPIYHLPRFRPEGVKKEDPFDIEEYFREQSRIGLLARFLEPAFIAKKALPNWNELEQDYHARLHEELEMIIRTGFSGYFLIVSDFIMWAKRAGIPVGPGRGSGAGSLVAYSLKITDIDPIQFKLLFERFINPERISMPDFDIDFCQERRSEVIEYVQKKYGKDNVCQIITFGKLQARAVIKDVGRVLGFSFAESDVLTKLLPDELNITLPDALEKEPRLRERMDQDPRTAKVMEYALSLEGLYRNAGIHAAGVIITEEPVVNYCPLYVGKDGDVVTQFDKDSAEKIGLVKFDFLGLKTLTVVDLAVKQVRLNAAPGTPEADFQLELIDYYDPKVFELISSGDTDGVFQVESSGMKDLCIRIQPNSLEDITAINALYRPGPLGSGMVDDFIDRKHGRKPIVYDAEALAPILKETYGVILYQEQVMQTARELAGYSLGQADLLRRAMGKKKADEMAMHREIFVKGATEKGLAREKAESIFDLMAKFAEYGFNKSHSAAYGVITYQTAFLKTHYPAEFMAALMTTEMDNTDKITKYIADARAHRIPVLPPDVNRSQKRFSVESVVETSADGKTEKTVKGIRFGLEAIKGVGSIAVDTILEARKNGLFLSVLDFTRRASTRKVNKKVLESLTLAGAFDAIAEVNRPSLFASLESLLQSAGDEQEERELGQTSLFDSFSADEVKLMTPVSAIFKSEPDWPRSRKLSLEKATVGFYVSGHPMDTWQKICEDWLGWSIERIGKNHERAQEEKQKKSTSTSSSGSGSTDAPPWAGEMGGGGNGRGGYQRVQRPEIRLGGLMGEFREVMTKKGARMGFGSFEDLNGKIEVVFFPEAYAQAQELIKKAQAEAEPLLLTAELEVNEESPKIFAKSVEWLSEAHRGQVNQVVLTLRPSQVSPDQLRELKKNFLHHRGRVPVCIDFVDGSYRTRLELPKTMLLQVSPQLVESINKIFGHNVVHLG